MPVRTSAFVVVSLAVLALTCPNMSCVSAAPSVSERPSAGFDRALDSLLNEFYEDVLSKRASDNETALKQLKNDDVDDLNGQIMGDQPLMEENASGGSNSTDDLDSARDR